MTKNLLARYNGRKLRISKDRAYKVAAQIAIKYGGFGRGHHNLTEDHIREFWGVNEQYPSFVYFRTNIKVNTIKWYIYNRIVYIDNIWNADFLHGLTTHGKIRWNVLSFPSFHWKPNDVILKLIKECPFGGKIQISRHYNYKKPQKYAWINAPSLYLKYSEDSISFIAGVMAGGQLFVKDGFEYAKFDKQVIPYLERYGIPIEYQSPTLKWVLISPIWIALFTIKMPTELNERWLNLRKPFKANIYAPILWKTYVNSNFPSKGIPYLKATRMLFIEFKCEEGAMKKLDMLRVETGLTQLHYRMREIVKIWSEKYERPNGKSGNTQ